MISLERLMILTSLQKNSSNVGDLGKIIVATSFEWLPKVQKIAQSGHTGCHLPTVPFLSHSFFTGLSSDTRKCNLSLS